MPGEIHSPKDTLKENPSKLLGLVFKLLAIGVFGLGVGAGLEQESLAPIGWGTLGAAILGLIGKKVEHQ